MDRLRWQLSQEQQQPETTLKYKLSFESILQKHEKKNNNSKNNIFIAKEETNIIGTNKNCTNSFCCKECRTSETKWKPKGKSIDQSQQLCCRSWNLSNKPVCLFQFRHSRSLLLLCPIVFVLVFHIVTKLEQPLRLWNFCLWFLLVCVVQSILTLFKQNDYSKITPICFKLFDLKLIQLRMTLCKDKKSEIITTTTKKVQKEQQENNESFFKKKSFFDFLKAKEENGKRKLNQTRNCDLPSNSSGQLWNDTIMSIDSRNNNVLAAISGSLGSNCTAECIPIDQFRRVPKILLKVPSRQFQMFHNVNLNYSHHQPHYSSNDSIILDNGYCAKNNNPNYRIPKSSQKRNFCHFSTLFFLCLLSFSRFSSATLATSTSVKIAKFDNDTSATAYNDTYKTTSYSFPIDSAAKVKHLNTKIDTIPIETSSTSSSSIDRNNSGGSNWNNNGTNYSHYYRLLSMFEQQGEKENNKIQNQESNSKNSENNIQVQQLDSKPNIPVTKLLEQQKNYNSIIYNNNNIIINVDPVNLTTNVKSRIKNKDSGTFFGTFSSGSFLGNDSLSSSFSSITNQTLTKNNLIVPITTNKDTTLSSLTEKNILLLKSSPSHNNNSNVSQNIQFNKNIGTVSESAPAAAAAEKVNQNHQNITLSVPKNFNIQIGTVPETNIGHVNSSSDNNVSMHPILFAHPQHNAASKLSTLAVNRFSEINALEAKILTLKSSSSTSSLIPTTSRSILSENNNLISFENYINNKSRGDVVNSSNIQLKHHNHSSVNAEKNNAEYSPESTGILKVSSDEIIASGLLAQLPQSQPAIQFILVLKNDSGATAKNNQTKNNSLSASSVLSFDSNSKIVSKSSKHFGYIVESSNNRSSSSSSILEDSIGSNNSSNIIINDDPNGTTTRIPTLSNTNANNVSSSSSSSLLLLSSTNNTMELNGTTITVKSTKHVKHYNNNSTKNDNNDNLNKIINKLNQKNDNDAHNVNSNIASVFNLSQSKVVPSVGDLRKNKCPSIPMDKRDIAWAETDAGVLALQVCPPPYHGTIYRSCFRNGQWSRQTDLSECRLIPLRILQQMIYSHVRKHLIDDLVRLTIELKDLLTSPKTPLYCPSDRLQSLETLNSILLYVGEKKLRIEPDLEQTRKTIDFIQAIVTISEHLLIRTQKLQFVSYLNLNLTNLINSEMQTTTGITTTTAKEEEKEEKDNFRRYNYNDNRHYQNILLRNKILDSIQGFCVLMENFVRALILSYEDGSIQQLARWRYNHPSYQQQHHRMTLKAEKPISTQWNTTTSHTSFGIYSDATTKKATSINNIEIWLSHQKLNEEIVFHLDSLMEFGAQSIRLIPFVTIVKQLLIHNKTNQQKKLQLKQKIYQINSHRKFSVNVNDISHLGVGITNIWLKNMGTNFLCTIGMNEFTGNDNTSTTVTATVLSDLAIVSIVPAVSIKVNFEIVPRFEIEFQIIGTPVVFENQLTKFLNENHRASMENNNGGENEQSNNRKSESNQIGCGRIMGNQANGHNKLPEAAFHRWSWSRDSCRTLWQNHTHIRCECNELGILAAVQFQVASSTGISNQKPKKPTTKTEKNQEDEKADTANLRQIINTNNNKTEVPKDDQKEEKEEKEEISNNSIRLQQLKQPSQLHYPRYSLLVVPNKITKKKKKKDTVAKLYGQQVSTLYYYNDTVEEFNSGGSVGYGNFNHFHNRIINSIEDVNTETGISRNFNKAGQISRFHSHGSDANFVHLSHHFTLYFSLIGSAVFLIVTLSVQFRNRHHESRETFFILRNLVLTLLMIQLTFLFGTTFHMDLFWIRVARLSPGANEFVETRFVKQSKHVLCLAVPIFLHFTHLASLFWMLSHSILLYQRFGKHNQNPDPEESSKNLPQTDRPTQSDSRKLEEPEELPVENSTNNPHLLAPSADQLNVTSRNFRKRFLRQNRIRSILGQSSKNEIPHPGGKLQKESNRKKCPYNRPSHLVPSSKVQGHSTGNNQIIMQWNIFCTIRNLMKQFFFQSFYNNNKKKIYSSGENVENLNKNLDTNSNFRSPNLVGSHSECEEICLELNSTSTTTVGSGGGTINQSNKIDSETLCSNLDPDQSSSSSSSFTTFSTNNTTIPTESNSNLILNNNNQTNLINVPNGTNSDVSPTTTISDHTMIQRGNCCCTGFPFCCFLSQTNSSSRRNGLSWKCHHYLSLSMGIPFVLVLTSYLLNPRGYETHRYCWMSIEGGIQYSFILPVLSLIATNTLLMLFILKRYFERKSLIHRSQIEKIRPSLRACIILLPFFTLNWFLSILSLEPLATSLFEHVFAFTNCLYSFLVWYFHSVQRYQINYLMPARFIRSRIRRQFCKLFHLNQWRSRRRRQQQERRQRHHSRIQQQQPELERNRVELQQEKQNLSFTSNNNKTTINGNGEFPWVMTSTSKTMTDGGTMSSTPPQPLLQPEIQNNRNQIFSEDIVNFGEGPSIDNHRYHHHEHYPNYPHYPNSTFHLIDNYGCGNTESNDSSMLIPHHCYHCYQQLQQQHNHPHVTSSTNEYHPIQPNYYSEIQNTESIQPEHSTTSVQCNSKCCKNSVIHSINFNEIVANQQQSTNNSTSLTEQQLFNQALFNQQQQQQLNQQKLFQSLLVENGVDDDDDEEVVIVELDDDDEMEEEDEIDSEVDDSGDEDDEEDEDDDDDTDDQQQMVIDYLRKNY